MWDTTSSGGSGSITIAGTQATTIDGGFTLNGNQFYNVIGSPAPSKPETAVKWLDRRVNEMRAKL